MAAYPTYKDSSIEWFGRIPLHWGIRRIESVSSEIQETNANLKYSRPSQFKFGEIAFKPDVNNEDEESLKKCTVFGVGDIVINGLNLNYDFITQRVAQSGYAGIITPAYIAIRVKNGLNTEYATYLFKSLDNQKVLNGWGHGIRLTLTYKELKKQDVLFPPQEEQRQIVAYLNYRLNKINERMCERESYKLYLN